jgi:hypothetical protein
MQRRGKPWSLDEVSFLRDNYGRLSPFEIALRLGRSYQGVTIKAQKVGITKIRHRYFGRKLWTEDEVETLKQFYREKDAESLARMLGRNPQSVYAKANHLGLKIRPTFWTSKEIELLKKHYPLASTREKIAGLFPNKTWISIRHKASRLGLKLPLYSFKTPKPSLLNEGKLSDFNVGYLAGIIDGEGTIGIFKSNRSKHHHVEISVGNTDRGIIEYVQRIIGGNIYESRTKNPRHRSSSKPFFSVKLNGLRNVQNALEKILPYLKSKDKKRKAQLILKYCNIRLSHYQNTPLTEEEQKILKEYEDNRC